MEAQAATCDDLWFLKSRFPAFWPASEALTLPEDKFQSYLAGPFEDKQEASRTEQEAGKDGAETSTAVAGSVTRDIRSLFSDLDDDRSKPNPHPFMKGLLSYSKKVMGLERSGRDGNIMLTENDDIAYRFTTDLLVDLFTELEDVVSGPRLCELLSGAWHSDPLATLKVIFNARSIHLGKASRSVFYRSAGWLAENHPLTLVANLRWLSRPVMEKKAEKKKEGDEDDDGMVLIGPIKSDDDFTRFDVKYGVAHGYWKDLLNILALSANGKLGVFENPSDILNVDRQANGHKNDSSKESRTSLRNSRHDAAIAAWENNPVHQALHLVVARLFAEQLRVDLALLRGDDNKAKKEISLCAKWAPSPGAFHDKHTFVASSIAEILHPKGSLSHRNLPKTGDEKADREIYLRYARDAYRKDVSALRKHLQVVERDITANNFANIKYDRVPSLAMNRHNGLFARKDPERFAAYTQEVCEGKAKISGATLLPSALIRAARPLYYASRGAQAREMKARVLDGQWRALVQRVRDSGTLDSCIAVCDVSGSMHSPTFADGTCPMDSAVGLSLLVAEVTAPPFGGAFITFSADPAVERVELGKQLHEKVTAMERSSWGMDTDFVAVFERLILPMAEEHQLTQEQMVKRVIVFSDMQFNSAESTHGGRDGWSSSFERIQKKFRTAGYEMPELVFWNLAGGRAGYAGRAAGRGGRGGGRGGGIFGSRGDPVAPKPVVADQEGTALVSGYSQAMLKLFMDKGVYGEEDEDEDEEGVDLADADDGDDDLAVVSKSKRQRMDPRRIVIKAISHKAYDMLQVMD